MSTHRKKLGLGWLVSVALFPKRRLLMGVFSDEFLFRTDEKLWLWGHYRLENEGRHFFYRASGVADADLQCVSRDPSSSKEKQLVQYLEHIALRYGPLQAT